MRYEGRFLVGAALASLVWTGGAAADEGGAGSLFLQGVASGPGQRVTEPRGLGPRMPATPTAEQLGDELNLQRLDPPPGGRMTFRTAASAFAQLGNRTLRDVTQDRLFEQLNALNNTDHDYDSIGTFSVHIPADPRAVLALVAEGEPVDHLGFHSPILVAARPPQDEHLRPAEDLSQLREYRTLYHQWIEIVRREQEAEQQLIDQGRDPGYTTAWHGVRVALSHRLRDIKAAHPFAFQPLGDGVVSILEQQGDTMSGVELPSLEDYPRLDELPVLAEYPDDESIPEDARPEVAAPVEAWVTGGLGHYFDVPSALASGAIGRLVQGSRFFEGGGLTPVENGVLSYLRDNPDADTSWLGARQALGWRTRGDAVTEVRVRGGHTNGMVTLRPGPWEPQSGAVREGTRLAVADVTEDGLWVQVVGQQDGVEVRGWIAAPWLDAVDAE